MALGEYQIQGFWTQEFLRDALEKGLIDFERFASACSTLAISNYFYLSLTPEIILEILRKDGYQLSGRVDAMLNILAGLDTIEDEAIRISSKLLRQLWFDPVVEEQRLLILDRLLVYLTNNRIMDRVLFKLRKLLAVELIVAPLQDINIRNAIISWRKLHPSTNSLVMGRRTD